MTDTKAWVAQAIRAAREQRGWSQGELARQLARTQTAISYWESGKRTPGLEDVMELARVLEREPADFLPPTTSRRPVRAVLRSTAERLAISDVDAAIDRLLEMADRREMPPKDINVRSRQPQTAASELLEKAAVDQVPVDVQALAERCGAMVIHVPFPDELSGLIFAERGGAVIGINASHPERRQRFSLAHECGHMVFGHHLSVSDPQLHLDVKVEEGAPPGYDWRQERASNDFAAELLMPRRFVSAAFNNVRNIGALAQMFDVSEIAMTYRLANLGLH